MPYACIYMHVYISTYVHTYIDLFHVFMYTHTLHMGYSDVSPGIRRRHLQGPKNADATNLGIHSLSHVFICVYKVHMCIYML